jgi:hypothetical protein
VGIPHVGRRDGSSDLGSPHVLNGVTVPAFGDTRRNVLARLAV